MIYHVTRATRIFIFWLLVFLAAGSIGLRFVLAEVKNYQSELESKISEILDIPLKIGKIRARMRGFNPELILYEISIADNSDNQAIKLREVRLGIKVLDVIKEQNLFASSWMTLVGAKITIKRKVDGRFAVIGLKANDDQPGWLMQGGHYEVLDSEVSWIDEQRKSKTEVIQHVNITLKNYSDHRHELRMQVNLPEHYGKTFTFMMNFSGDLFTKNLFTANLYAKAEQIRLTELFANEMPAEYLLNTGLSDFQLWSEWKDSKMVSVSGEIRARHGSVSLNKAQSIPFEDLSAQFRWQRQIKKWQLDVNQLTLKSKDKQWPEASFSLAVTDEKKLTAVISQVDLGQLSEWLLFSQILGERHAKWLENLNLQGTINSMSAIVDTSQNDFSINGEIQNFGFTAVETASRVQGLTARIKGTHKNGSIKLKSDSAQLQLNTLFNKPIKITRINGLIDWHDMDKGWRLSSKRLTLENPDLKTRNRFEITIPKADKPLFVDWQSDLTKPFDVSNSKAFFPVKKMDKGFSSYLNQLFIAGKINQGQLLFYGQPDEFPFSLGQGVFRADLAMENLDLSYSSDWPKLTQLQGHIDFTNQKIAIIADTGQLSGQQISHLQATLSSWRQDAIWRIKGNLSGKVEQSLAYLQNSPLASKIEPVVKVIAPQGRNAIDVDLLIPVDSARPATVKVITSLKNAAFKVLPVDLSVTKVEGDLIFTEQHLFCQNLTGYALGYPIEFNIYQDIEKSIFFDVSGNTDVEHLQAQFPNTAWGITKGSLAYQLQLTLPDEKSQASTLQIKSDLIGMQVNLPETLSKQIDQTKPLQLDLSFTENNLMPVKINYADQLKMAVMFDTSTATIYSANLLYGKGNPRFKTNQGLDLSIDQEQLDLNAWLMTRKNINAHSEIVEQLNHVDFQVQKLNWYSRNLGQVRLELTQHKERLSGAIDTPFLNGKVAIMNHDGKDKKVVLDLKRLNLTGYTDLSAKVTSGSNIMPADLPLFEVKSEKVFWKNTDIGSLDLVTSRIPDGLDFSRFDIKSNNAHLTTEFGQWVVKNGKHQTNLKSNLKVKNLGVLLSSLALTEALVDTQSKFDIDFQWLDTPFQVSLKKLTGTVKARMNSGRLLGVEPGIGRILGLLDLWQLDKRIRLDFSDLFLKGLSYDDIYGDYLMINGTAMTDNLVINAASAKIKISGKTDLITKTMDQEVFVIPKSAEVLPIAGKIVGGVAGAVAEGITGKSKEGMFFGAHYKLEGPWDNPEVISQPDNDGLLRKVWTGITDFSWLNSKNNKELINE